MTAVHAAAFMNSQRDVKKHPKPFEVVMPWTGKADFDSDVTPEERAALKARLLKHSAFAGRGEQEPS
ncbi:hypothetical protein [Agreia sp. COWG]|uniref:hypothetical protein n=1 Tax=Agreia sp. COWG TaxID=2773266 RepID=UPI001926FC50|nr:hypothetical protein [Agreia sp. COWG]CAD5999217.1 conserved protein of unknown function [Agreia sp. COWG]